MYSFKDAIMSLDVGMIPSGSGNGFNFITPWPKKSQSKI